MANGSGKNTIRRLGAAALGLTAFCMVLLAGAPAQAAPDVLRPGTHPWWFAGGIGPAFGVTSEYGRGWGSHWNQFALTEEIGGHFSGEFEGPALGAHFQQGFGNHFFRSTIGLRFWYDIQVVDDLGLYIAPDGQLGWTYIDTPGGDHFLNFQFGAAGRLILGDRGMVFARVACFDFNFGDIWWLNYNLILGGGVTW
jgi:hypothetical protein